jgi:hypothetical protein
MFSEDLTDQEISLVPFAVLVYLLNNWAENDFARVDGNVTEEEMIRDMSSKFLIVGKTLAQAFDERPEFLAMITPVYDVIAPMLDKSASAVVDLIP